MAYISIKLFATSVTEGSEQSRLPVHQTEKDEIESKMYNARLFFIQTGDIHYSVLVQIKTNI